MIAYLEGEVLKKSWPLVILKAGGVGYEVLVNLRAYGTLPAEGQRASLWIHTQVKEDGITLVGFSDLTERSVYLHLTSVSGIGPKVAVNILSQVPPAELAAAVREKDVGRLTMLKGVGKKTAERILVELAEKEEFAELALSAAAAPARGGDGGLLGEVRQALENLGYRRKEIDPVLEKLKMEPSRLTNLESAILRALALLGG
jgi:Holliday junction DNA helicase RuvA